MTVFLFMRVGITCQELQYTAIITYMQNINDIPRKLGTGMLSGYNRRLEI